jgi:hypothetical protein
MPFKRASQASISSLTQFRSFILGTIETNASFNRVINLDRDGFLHRHPTQPFRARPLKLELKY